MKRSSKILTLLLALVLVFGAVTAIVASADSEIINKAKADFEGQTVGAIGSSLGGITFDKKSVTEGMNYVEGADGNIYAYITMPTTLPTANPYFHKAGSRASTSNVDAGTIVSDDISNYKFMKMGIDVIAPTGKIIDLNIDPYFHYLNADGANSFWTSNAKSVYLRNDANGTYLYSSINSANKIYFDPTVFNRIEVIYENVSTVDAETGKYTPILKQHVYLNGELVISGSAGSSVTYYKDTPAVSFYRPQMTFEMTSTNPSIKNHGFSKEDLSIGFDNITIDVVKAGSTLEAKDLATKVETAEVNGVKYYDITEAIEAAPMNGTVTLLKDIVAPVTVSKPVVIEAGEFDVTLKAGTNLGITQNGTTYTVKGIITTMFAEDFSDLPDDWGSTTGFDADKFAYTKSTRITTAGSSTLGKDSSGNRYAIYNEVGGTTSNAYIGTGYGGVGSNIFKGRPTTGNFNTFTGSVEFTPYTVFDWDIASPTGVFANLSLAVQGRYLNSAGSLISKDGLQSVATAADTYGSYIQAGGKKVYVNPYEFTHVTFIIEGVTTEDYCHANYYTYVNGELLAYTEGTDYGTAGSAKYYNGVPHWCIDEIRIGLGVGTDATQSLAMDNMTTRLFGQGYTLNDILTTYDLNDDTKKPVIPVAKIGDVEYTDIEEAVAALKDNDTIEVLIDVENSVIVNNEFSNVTFTGKEVTLVAGNGMELTNEGNVYTSTQLKPKLFQYEKGGQLVYGVDTLAAAIADADAGSTVKFLADYVHEMTGNAAYIDIGKVLTIDLNGYTLKAYNTDANKSSLFRMTSGTDITVTSSVVGGKLFHEGWKSDGTTPQSAGTFQSSNDTGIFRIKGNNAEGEITLTIVTGCLANGYSTSLGYYIDGGMFVCKNGSDQMGFIDSRKAGRDAEIKNAFFYIPAHGSGLLGYSGRNTPVDNEGTVVVDNCVVIGHLTAGGFVAPQKMIVTNSYITGSVNPIVSNTYKTMAYGGGDYLNKANTPGTVVIGAGNYFGTTLDLTKNIEFAEGVKLFDVNVYKEFTYSYNTWTKGEAASTFDPSSFELTTETKASNFKYYAADIVTVIWKDTDGTVIGKSEACAGFEAPAPTTFTGGIEVVPGWVNSVPAEWNESLVVPTGVEEYVITAKEGSARTLVSAVQLLCNIGITSHFTYNMYIPVRPEGIELTWVTFAGTGTNRLGNVSGTYTINGQTYNRTQGWPGLQTAGKTEMAAGIKFTYAGQEFEVSSSVSMTKYCDYIVNSGVNYSTEAKALAVNAANYIVKSGVTNATLSDIVANNTSLIKSMDKTGLTAPDTSATAPYVASAQVVIGSFGPNFRFNLTDAGKAATVTLSNNDGGDYATNGYIQTKNNLAMSYFNNVTLKVTDGDTTVSITYTLEDYYAQLSANGADAATLEFVDAMYGFLTAANAY